MSDDLLGPLRDEPVPPLTPAATVRARGDQRRRRARASLAGAGVLLVALVGVTASAVGGPGGGDALRPAPFASSEPVTQEDPAYAALLDPQDVGAVLGGTWEVDRRNPSTFSSSLEGCPETPGPIEGPAAGRFLVNGARTTGQHLEVLPDEAAAAERYGVLVEMIRECSDAGRGYRVFSDFADRGPRAYGDAGDDVPRPFALERIGRVVLTTMVDGDLEPSPELADAAAEEVRSVFGDDAPEPTGTPVTEDQLLDGPTLESVLGGSWSAAGDLREDVYPTSYACPEGVTAAPAGLVRSLESGDQQRVSSQVLRYPGADAAGKMLGAMQDDVRRCPSRPEDSEDGRALVTHELVADLPGAGPDRFYVRSVARDCDDCPPRAGVTAVARVGDLLVLAGVPQGLEPDLPRIADAAVARAAGTPSTQGTESAEALLRPQDAARAEAGEWQEEPDRVLPSPLLDPCGERPGAAQRANASSRSLVLRREAGGTTFAQEASAYVSSGAAERAFEEYRDAVETCPREPGREIPESTTTYEVLDAPLATGVRTLLVRSERTCPTCSPGYGYYVVQQTGALLSVSVTELGEDGDPGRDPATALAAAVAERMIAATG